MFMSDVASRLANRVQLTTGAYDLVGNKSVPSNIVRADLPMEVELPPPSKAIARPSFMKASPPMKVEEQAAKTEIA